MAAFSIARTETAVAQFRRCVDTATLAFGAASPWVTHLFVLADLVSTGTSTGEGLVPKAHPSGAVQVLARLPSA